MNYTEEQFQALTPFVGYFRTATRSGYAGYVGFRNAERIDKIIRDAGLYNSRARTNFSCAACVLRILRIAGTAYFEDQEARLAAANDKEAAKLSAEAAAEPASAPSSPKAAPTSTKTTKAAKTAQKSKTAK